MEGHLFCWYSSHCLGCYHMKLWVGTLDWLMIHCFEDDGVVFRPACISDQVDFLGQVEGLAFYGQGMIFLVLAYDFGLDSESTS